MSWNRICRAHVAVLEVVALTEDADRKIGTDGFPPQTPATARRIDPDLTTMLSNPALTGMPRSDFERLVAVSEPYWDALAEAAFQRRFHRPRSYLHPQTSSLDHYHRLLAALLRRRRVITSTLLAQLPGVTRTNPSPTSSKTGTGSWTCIASPSHRCLGRPPGPSNSFEFACLTRTIRKINPDSYSETSPRPHRELPDRRLRRLRHQPRTRPGRPRALPAQVLDG